MSNYITIESGYFEPFKENETDQELMELADKYCKIKNDIQEVFLKCCHSEEYCDKHIRDVFDCLSKLEEELCDCLLHRTWVGEKSILINESNIVNVEYLHCLDQERRDRDVLSLKTGELTTWVWDFGPYYMDEDIRRYIDQIEQIRVKEYVGSYFEDDAIPPVYNLYEHLINFAEIFSKSAILKTYKDFQSNKIEKIKKDKIKCGSFETRN